MLVYIMNSFTFFVTEALHLAIVFPRERLQPYVSVIFSWYISYCYLSSYGRIGKMLSERRNNCV